MRYLDTCLIDERPILVPDENAEISRSDIDAEDSGRDESGIMHRFVVRERVMKWVFNYAHLTKEEYNYLKSLTEGKPEFQFSFFGDVYTAYCSNDSAVLRNAITGEYKDFKLTIIEC
jgi:hypothetical protein